MKTIHKYNQELEDFLMYLTNDELSDWFQSNTIEYSNPDLLEVMNGG